MNVMIFKYALPIITIIMLSNCGYKLRNYENIFQDASIQILFEDTKLNQEFVSLFQSTQNVGSLIQNNANIETDFIIEIYIHSLDKYSIALDRGIQTSEARLEYSLEYSIKSEDSTQKYFDQIFFEKSFPYDESRILAGNIQQEIILREFISKAIRAIILSAKLRFK